MNKYCSKEVEKRSQYAKRSTVVSKSKLFDKIINRSCILGSTINSEYRKVQLRLRHTFLIYCASKLAGLQVQIQTRTNKFCIFMGNLTRSHLLIGIHTITLSIPFLKKESFKIVTRLHRIYSLHSPQAYSFTRSSIKITLERTYQEIKRGSQ